MRTAHVVERNHTGMHRCDHLERTMMIEYGRLRNVLQMGGAGPMTASSRLSRSVTPLSGRLCPSATPTARSGSPRRRLLTVYTYTSCVCENCRGSVLMTTDRTSLPVHRLGTSRKHVNRSRENGRVVNEDGNAPALIRPLCTHMTSCRMLASDRYLWQ